MQAALFGDSYRDFSAIIGWKDLHDANQRLGDNHEFTTLTPNLEGKDPDEAFSVVPYEKGYTFLSYLEAQVGKDKWSKYIPEYFKTFAKRSLTSTEFKDHVLSYFASDSLARAALDAVKWEQWFHTPGLPPKPAYDTTLADVCYDLAAKWATPDYSPAESDLAGWKAKQIVVFLNSVKDFERPLDKERVRLMGHTYKFLESKNVEVTSRFFSIGLKSRLESVYRLTAELLGNVGRMKFVRPL